jgi:hypothetical protein
MRLKTDIWVQALLRTGMTQGLFGTVVKKGAPEAGAVFVIINRLDGRYQLLGPAPGMAYDEAGDRQFIAELPFPSDLATIENLLQRRQHFDPDLWIVEIEDRHAIAQLKIISA